MISVGNNKAVICKGDFHPAQLYKGDKKIAGYSVEKFEGTGGVELTGCYNDKLHDVIIEGNTIQQLLPIEYQQIEYIESTGEQYIDTGVIPNQNTGFEIEFITKNAISSTSGEYGSVFGARTSSSVDEYQLTTYYSSSKTPDYRGTFRFGTASYDGGISSDEKNKISLQNGLYVKSDGNEVQLEGEFETPCTLTLFALNQNGTPTQHGTLRLYMFKIYDGDNLLRDFIPCYRKSDAVIGLYDIVNNVFYKNAGDEVFTKGVNISSTPTPKSPIEIQSVGELVTEGEHAGKYKVLVTARGKNYFDLNKVPFNKSTTQSYNNGLKAQKISGANRGTKIPISLPVDRTIHMTMDVVDSQIGGTAKRVTMGFYNSSGTLVWQTGISSTIAHKSYSFTLLEEVSYIQFIFIADNEINTVGDYVTMDNIMLRCEGDNSFEPYIEPQTVNIYLDEPLRKVGDYADYIDSERHKIVKNIKQETITEIGAMSSASSTYRRFTPRISEKPLKSGGAESTKGVAISNKFKSTDVAYGNLGKTSGAIIPYISTAGANMVAITFNSTSINTVAKAQNAIGDGFDVCYILAEPTEEDIEFPELPTFKGTTIYEVDTQIPATISGKYKKMEG